MSIVPIVRGKTYRLGPDDQAQFPAELKTLVGDATTKTDGRLTYRWGTNGIAFIWDVKEFFPTDNPLVYGQKPVVVVVPNPEPDPTTPPPVPDIFAVTVGGESFIQNKYWTIATNYRGGLGSLYNAPLGFRSQGESINGDGLVNIINRVGLLSSAIPYADLSLQGRAQEGMIWKIDGVVSANIVLHGYYQFPGDFADPFRWNGEKSGIQYKQKIELDDDIVRIIMTNTNVSTKNLPLRFGRVLDPDSVKSFLTTQKVLADGVIEMKLDDGAKITMTAPDAQFYRCAYTEAQNFNGTVLTTATAARKADDTIKAIWPEVVLAPGESKSVILEYRATAKPA